MKKKKTGNLLMAWLVACLCLLCTACGGSGGSTAKQVAGDSYSSYNSTNDGAVYENSWEDNASDAAQDDANAEYDEEVYEDDASSGAPAEGKETVSEENDSASNRKLIKTVNMVVETLEFDKLISSIRSQTEALGGYIENSNVYGTDYYGEGSKSASFVVRIPEKNLSKFTNKINDVGNVTQNEEHVDDVTLNYVDVQSHIASLREEQKRLNELVAQADNLDDILRLESELTQIRYELENYESQKRVYDNQIDFSTVNLNIRQVKEMTEPEPEEEPGAFERMTEGFLNNLGRLAEELVDLSVYLISSLPYLVFYGLIIFVIVLIIKKIGKKKRIKREKSSRNPSGEEYFDVLRPDGTKTGRTKRRDKVHRDGDLHAGAHVWIIGEEHEDGSFDVLLQRRSQTKDAFPGCLDAACTGHVDAGEEFLGAAVREIKEELNLMVSPKDLMPLFQQKVGGEYIFHGKPFRNNEINQVYLLSKEVPLDTLKVQESEIEGMEWKNSKEVQKEIMEGNKEYCIGRFEIDHVIEAVEKQREKKM